MWKVTNKKHGSVMTIFDSTGKGYLIKSHESIIIDKEPIRETPSMIIEEIVEKKKVEKKKEKKVEKENDYTKVKDGGEDN